MVTKEEIAQLRQYAQQLSRATSTFHDLVGRLVRDLSRGVDECRKAIDSLSDLTTQRKSQDEQVRNNFVTLVDKLSETLEPEKTEESK